MRLPRRHANADRNNEKDKRTLSHPITTEYRSFFFSANILARCLKVTAASGPIPPAVEKTNGVKQPISTCLTRSPYSLFSSFHVVGRGWSKKYFGMRKRTDERPAHKKNASCIPVPQKPLTRTCSRASSDLFAEFRRHSSVTG